MERSEILVLGSGAAGLSCALRLALTLHPSDQAQATGQREIVSSLEDALDARRQRVIVSEASVGWVKWLGIILLAALTLVAIACVHSDNKRSAAIALGIAALSGR